MTNFIIDDISKVEGMPEHIKESLLNFDKDVDYSFVIPSHIINNQKKNIYKVGFLKSFYKCLFPEMRNKLIFEKIRTNWQVFLSNRQQERLCAKYVILFKKKEDA